MPRLKDRQRQIPGGLQLLVPETKWRAPAYASFETIVMQLIAHRQANPYLAQQHGWSTDPDTVRDYVDSFNASICKRMGWTEYYTEGGAETALPFQRPTPPPTDPSKLSAVANNIKAIWAGLKTVNDWMDSNEPAVESSLSESRAKICSECPLNEVGNLETWFTRPAAEGIKRQIEKFSARNLTTSYDSKLHTCKACLCVNSLSVHVPIAIKVAHMSQETFDVLKTAPACWVVDEGKAIGRV